MLAFPGVIYSQLLYFEWLSPSITEDTGRTERRERETGRERRRVATGWATGEKGRQDRPCRYVWRAEGSWGCEKKGGEREDSGWLASTTGNSVVLFPILLALQSLASFRFTSFYLHERTRMYILVSVCFFHSPGCLHRAKSVHTVSQSCKTVFSCNICI